MRHRVYGRKLGRNKNQRIALFRGLVRSLILNESITTTEAKAKAIKSLVDRLIAKSKEKTEAAKRVVVSTVAQPDVSKKLLEEIAPRYKDRTSGFTSIVKTGRRVGDGAMMVKMSLVEGQEKSGARSQGSSEEIKERKKKPAKNIKEKISQKGEKKV